MGLLRFCTKKTFVEVDVSSIDGSSKDARKVQSWGGPNAITPVLEDFSTDCSDEEVSGEVDDWEADGSDRVTTCSCEDDLDVQKQVKTFSTQSLKDEDVTHASSLIVASAASVIASPQPTNVVFVQCLFPVASVLLAPQNALQAYTFPSIMTVTQSRVPNLSDQSDSTLDAAAASRSHHGTSSKREDHAIDENVNPTWTSRMVRNIPNDYTRQDFLDLLNFYDIAFDFVYLPMDWHKDSNLGYAFVNLVSNHEAVRIAHVLNGFTDWKVQTQKVCDVVWGKPSLQSLQRTIDKFRNSAIMHSDVPDTFKPMVFKAGQRVPFPAPTVKLQKPRGCK